MAIVVVVGRFHHITTRLGGGVGVAVAVAVSVVGSLLEDVITATATRVSHFQLQSVAFLR